MTDYDYIVVGAGPAGCALAKRLADHLPRQNILLLDAGGPNEDKAHQTFGERHWTLTVPGYNWGYKTVSQPELDSREVDYSRGKGLGGSTAINFCVYTRGPSADYDHWSALVEDPAWAWENVEKRFDRVENFHHPISEASGYVAVADDGRGKRGYGTILMLLITILTRHSLVDVGVTEIWDPGFDEFMKNAYHYHPKNNNHNSGNPIGISVCQLSACGGHRVTASGAYLASTPSNLTIMTNATVTKLVLKGKSVVGVEYSLLTEFYTSGIGPSQDLSVLGIPVVQDLPGVGKNLQDRLFLELVTVQDPGSHHRTSYIDSPSALGQARKEWTKNKSGPLSDYYLPQMIAYLKSDKIASSKEFEDLDDQTRQFMHAETKPFYEIVSQNPSPSVKAPEKYLSTAVAFPGNHGSGSIRLASLNSNDPPIIDPKFLSHPFDKRVAIESVRETLTFLKQPLMAKGSLRFAAGPDGHSDEEILVRNIDASSSDGNVSRS
ncbi:MAG: hypothetical protein Q9198_001702 [Flavoplaca austrocitrina]